MILTACLHITLVGLFPDQHYQQNINFSSLVLPFIILEEYHWSRCLAEIFPFMAPLLPPSATVTSCCMQNSFLSFAPNQLTWRNDHECWWTPEIRWIRRLFLFPQSVVTNSGHNDLLQSHTGLWAFAQLSNTNDLICYQGNYISSNLIKGQLMTRGHTPQCIMEVLTNTTTLSCG